MMKNKALQEFMNSIDKKIEESEKVNKTLNNLLRLIEIIDNQKQLERKVKELVLSISNNCIYSKSKLIKVKEGISNTYEEMDSLQKEFTSIEDNLPIHDKYYSSIGTNFEVKKSLMAIRKEDFETARFFIEKFKYEIEYEKFYKENKRKYKNIKSNK